jgi:hypothetical protein
MIDTENERFNQSPLGFTYWCLRGEKYAHNVALWAAWYAHKADKELMQALGLPVHQYELAEILGVTDRTLRNYRKKYSRAIETAGAMMVDGLLRKYVPGALDAMGEMAGKKESAGYNDRRLLFEMANLYTPKQKQVIDLGVDLTSLSDEELDALDKSI